MHKRFLFIYTALAFVACSAPNDAPDTVFFEENVRVFKADTIYTGNPDEPTISGFAVNNEGIIVATFPVGSEAAPHTADGAVESTVFSGTMFPGFVDGHAHLSGIGSRELTLDLTGTASIGELVTHLDAITSDKVPGEIIFGRGWIETDWPEGRMPIAADLDAVSPNNPVILVRADGHALVANTAAMDAAQIGTDTPDPDGGSIERSADGQATGIFIDKAMDLIRAQVSTPSDSDMSLALKTGAQVYANRGWTGLHNMSVTPREAELMAALGLKGELPLRISNYYDPSGLQIAADRAHETPLIRNRGIKIYMDGALGSRGALLSAPYSDRPETSGLALRGKEETLSLLATAVKSEIQVAFHAIGDKANADALDWMSEATRSEPGARWRIEHAQILHTDDISRFGQAGIIASMQPSHAIGDLKFAPDRLGLERLTGAYAWQSVLETGGVVVGGSDAPVEVGSPLIEFYAAVARKTLDGISGDGWHPEQAVSREDALAMFTRAPAFASFQEGMLGTLEVGKLADMSVFDRDLMTVPEADILQAKAVATIIAGDVVWRAE